MTDSAAPLRRVADIPSALDAFDALQARLGGRRPVIFLDYDGTLTPIVERPDLAVLSDEARGVVGALARALPVAVVSGRDRPDVQRLVGLDSVIYAGSHGFDVTVPGKGPLEHGAGEDFTALLDGVAERLHAALDPIPGALLERKKFSIAAHYRQVADADTPAFRAALDAIVAATPGIKEKPGKKVFELQPAIDWDKGKCVLFLLDALSLDDGGHVPMFFGDDVTDEDAFTALHDRGIGVVVADDADPARRTAAHFRVADPDELIALLRRLTPA
ncbi:trehalose-phosphatase [Novispirillum sp. DQ9]|uniref:trehalose-phosphatase n=1 Tax=Novispirillum sp. DQ9 TaxID=3398612 RepID=UPI003C7E544E